MRVCEVLAGEGWKVREFKYISEGDVFRLWDDGKRVIDDKGCMMFKATSNAYLGTHGEYTVLYEGVK